MYKISIITVTYNCFDQIPKTINSILPFLNEEVQLVIVDGSSTDGTKEYLTEIAKVNNNIKFLSETDQGIYDAMNKGVKFSDGEWICFINCGDFLYKIPKINESINVFATCYAVETENGNIYPKFSNCLKYSNTIPHQGLFYRRSLFPGFDLKYKIFADYALNIDMFKDKKIITTHKDIISFHSIEGISNNIKAKNELVRLLKEKNSRIDYYISLLRFKFLGLRKRLANG